MANLLQKQGFYNSLILYSGTALGFLNLAILFQRFLTIEEIGFFSLMIAISLLYAQISSLGISNIIIKFFPYYRTDDKKHGGFITFAILWCLAGFSILTVFFIFFKNDLINHYRSDKGSQLLVKYYYYLVPAAFLTMLYAVLESIAGTMYKNVLSAFLREVFLRFFTSISVLLIAASLLNYQDFLLVYIASNIVMVLILLCSIYKSRDFKMAPISQRIHIDKIKLLKYGIFTVLSSTSFVLIQNLDIMMLTGITKDLKLVGIYTTFFAIAVVISLPSKALSRTSLQIVAQSWVNNDLAKISKIYYKTSVVQMLIGCLLFIGIVTNRELILLLLHKIEYANYFNVFIVVGLAFLVDMTGGLNGYILNVSSYYKWTTYIIGGAVIICAISNWILIPRIGILGAAISYFLTMLLLNFVYWIVLKIKFDLQPFGKAHFLIILISIVASISGWLIPTIYNFWISAIVRSLTLTVIYIILSYSLKISEDINLLFDKVIKFKKN